MRYYSQKSGSEGNNVMNSVQVRNQILNQSPIHASVKNDISQQIITSPLNNQNSKYSQSPASYKNKKTAQNEDDSKNPSEISVRLFKDITHKMHPENLNITSSKLSPYYPKESQKAAGESKKTKRSKAHHDKHNAQVPATKIVF